MSFLLRKEEDVTRITKLQSLPLVKIINCTWRVTNKATVYFCVRIDWCCFYYSIRNSVVALLEALLVWIFLDLRSRCTVIFSIHFDVCACNRRLSLAKSYFRPSQPGSCACFSPFLVCAVLECVHIYAHMKVYNEVININKYKQNRDNITCNIKVEIEIHVHRDVKQAVKCQVFRHVTEYNTNKLNTISVSVWRSFGHWKDLGLWLPV